MRKYLFLPLLIAGFVSCAPKQETAAPGRMDRSRLNIGTYILNPYARTEAHIRDIADCGIDFVVCMQNDREALDLFEKYGIGAIVSGVVPGWWGGDGSNAGQLCTSNPMEKYSEAAALWEDHPAVWGIDIGDEPSALDFPYYGRVFEKVDSLFPEQFPYLNLYPNYASVAVNNAEQTVNQLGTETYKEHIAEYVKNVPSDYICYDFYVYSCDVPHAYDNLRIVSDACRESGRSMWIVLQVNSLDPDVWTSVDRLRFQAWTAMAFGAENIIWACYTAGWWSNQVLDENGEKTEQYDKLKIVNGEIRILAEPYMKYRTVATTFVGFEGTAWLEGLDEQSVPELNDGTFQNLRFEDGAALVAGSMVPRCEKCDSKAVFVCAADDPYDEAKTSHVLRFRTDAGKVTATGAEGSIPVQRDSEGYFSIPMTSNTGVLIEAR
ncbi:MAG: hypothetical protein ACI399_04430 [Candidatus Cryptobacteroides sp.]